MLIANAIYDVIFKYLMEDDLIAKDILSVILNVEIISLQLQPQEVLSHTKGGITIFRIDFNINNSISMNGNLAPGESLFINGFYFTND